MVKTIKVTSGIVPVEHDTFTESLQVSKSRREKKQNCTDINGQIVTSYDFDGQQLVIGYENNKYSLIKVGTNSIDFDVYDSKPEISLKSPTEKIVFEFPNGEKSGWSWKHKLDSMLGKQVAFSPSQQYLFLFIKGQSEELMIDFVEDKSTERYMQFE